MPSRRRRLGTNKNTFCYYCWGVQNPLKSPSPGPGIDPYGPETRFPSHPERFPDLPKFDQTIKTSRNFRHVVVFARLRRTLPKIDILLDTLAHGGAIFVIGMSFADLGRVVLGVLKLAAYACAQP